MALLTLNISPRTAVFRKIESILRNDSTLKRVVKVWRTWRERPGEVAPFGIEQASGGAAIRITPVNGPELWKFPDAFVGPLYLKFEILSIGADCDDPLNLWWAIERAIYPLDTTVKLAQIRALQEAGAYSGLTEFSSPAFDPDPDGTFWACIGQAKVDILLNLNT